MANSRIAQTHILQKYLGDVATAVPSTWYVGFFYQAPNIAGTSTGECTSYSGYSRTAVANTPAQWTWDGANFLVKNANDITCCTATAAWAQNVSHVGLFASGTAGTDDLWFYESLASGRLIQSGTTIIFKAGALIITNPGT